MEQKAGRWKSRILRSWKSLKWVNQRKTEIETITKVTRSLWLRWYRHVERMSQEKRIVVREKKIGRLRKRWKKLITVDITRQLVGINPQNKDVGQKGYKKRWTPGSRDKHRVSKIEERNGRLWSSIVFKKIKLIKNLRVYNIGIKAGRLAGYTPSAYCQFRFVLTHSKSQNSSFQKLNWKKKSWLLTRDEYAVRLSQDKVYAYGLQYRRSVQLCLKKWKLGSHEWQHYNYCL